MKSKSNIKRISFSWAVRLFVALLAITSVLEACNKMDYTYKKFLKDGDIVYPGNADSIQIFPGKNRIKLTWLLTSDPTIVMSRVYWNNKADSVNVPVSRGQGVDTISVIIDSLDEGFYNFEIYTYDNNGNSSVGADTIGQVFGKVYSESLHNRIIKKLYWDSDTAYIQWYDPATGAINLKLNYTDADGTSHSLTVPNSDTATSLPNFKFHDGFDYVTGYLPDSLAIDTFFTASAHFTVDDTLSVILPPFPSPDGQYAIYNKNSGMAVAVEGSSKSNNANIEQEAFIGAANQLWTFKTAPTADYYEIDNVNSGNPQAIAVKSGSKDDGANVLQYKFGSGGNDQWMLEKVDGAFYKLTNKNSQKVLEVAGSSTDAGGNIQQNSWSGGDNQLFKLVWNLALNKTVSAKSSDASAGRVAGIIDGDPSTFWQMNSGDRADLDVWAVINLEDEQVVNAMDQIWTHNNSHIDHFTIYTSNDNVSWKQVYQSKTGIDDGDNTVMFPPVKAQYVKLDVTLKDNANVNLAEARVYYTPQ